MNEISFPKTTKHVIVKKNDDVYIYFVVEPQNQFSTVFEIVGIFDSKEDAELYFPNAENLNF